MQRVSLKLLNLVASEDISHTRSKCELYDEITTLVRSVANTLKMMKWNLTTLFLSQRVEVRKNTTFG